VLGAAGEHTRGIVQRFAQAQTLFDFPNGKIDRERLTRWMDVQMSVVDLSYPKPFPPGPFITGMYVPIHGGQAAISTPRGAILAMNPRHAFRTDSPMDNQLTEDERAVWEAARQGRTTSRHVGSQIVVAVPLGARDGQASAIGFYRTSPLFTQRNILSAVVFAELHKAAQVVLFSTLISGCLGALTAQRLTHRFEAIARVADDWSQGSFSMTAPETPRDELGLLGRRLNLMAADLHSFISLRRELAAIEERNRIARDLHDTVKQHVFAAGLQVGAMRARLSSGDDTGAAQSLNELEQLTRQMRADLAGILNELRPFDGAEGGAAEAIRRLVTDWSRQSGIETACSVMPVSHLPDTMTRELYRVTQEALANIARHSGASHVSVILREESGALLLEISDKGKGFVPTASRTGLGLHTMRERAESLPGGSIQIESAPGKGTCITVRCRWEGRRDAAGA